MKNHSLLKKWTATDYILSLIMIAIIVIVLFPMLNVLALSFSSTEHINSGSVTIFPKGFNIEAYKRIFSSDKIPRAYLNTLIYTSVGTCFNVFFTVITAYPLARKELKGRKPLTMFIVFTMFFNAGMIPGFLLVSNLKLIDTIWALILPGLISTFYLIVVRNAFESIPEELHEACIVDGASEYRIMFQIYMPLAKASIASITLYYIMGRWNAFFTPSIYLNTAEKYPLQVILRDMLMVSMSEETNNIIDAAAITPVALKNATIFISVIPMLIIYPLIQKHFAKGMMVGAVKG